MTETKHDPTAEEMREFATYFTDETWKLCCNYQEFLDGVSYDIKEAGIVAMLVLAHHGYYDDDEPPAPKGKLVLK